MLWDLGPFTFAKKFKSPGKYSKKTQDLIKFALKRNKFLTQQIFMESWRENFRISIIGVEKVFIMTKGGIVNSEKKKFSIKYIKKDN